MMISVRLSGATLMKHNSGVTWARHVYYRRNVFCYLQNLCRQFCSSYKETSLAEVTDESQNELVAGTSNKKMMKKHTSLLEKVRTTHEKRYRTTPRQFTAKELEEEEKFAKFLSEDFWEKEEENFGDLGGVKPDMVNVSEDEGSVRRLFDEGSDNLSIDMDKSFKKYNLPKGWSKEFGTLTQQNEKENVETRLDPGIQYMKELQAEEELADVYNHIPLGNRNRKHEPDWYSRRIIKLSKQGHIAEAIQVFDDWMIKRDRVKPTDFEYSVLISALGKVGYTKKAFNLFNEMVRKGYKIHPKIYSALFNACSNSPWPEEDGLKRARDLRTFMLVRNIRPEYLTYQAMIKAFGMCGDLKTAFALADEAAHFYRVNDNLLTSLLVGCITDKEAGFRHAVMVWRRFQKFGIFPEIRAYKLLMKATIECDIGEQKLLKQLLGIKQEHITKKISEMKVLENGENSDRDSRLSEIHLSNGDVSVQSGTDLGSENTDSTDISVISSLVHTEKPKTDSDGIANMALLDVPSILDPEADFSEVLSVGKVVNKHDRFVLLGNVKGVLKSLKENRVKPDIELFTYLIEVVPERETEIVLNEMIKAKVNPDIEFCNRYLKRLIFEGKDVQEVTDVMQALKITPNMKTYTVLAYGCKNADMAASFLNTMEKSGMMPNILTMRGLVRGSYLNFRYKTYLLKQMTKYNIKPDQQLLELIEDQINMGHQKLRQMDKGEIPRQSEFITTFDKFLAFYEDWTKKADMVKEDHPWNKLYMEKSGKT